MSTISAGTTSTTTLIHSGDTTGSLVFKTNDTGSGGTTAVTIDTSQNATFAKSIILSGSTSGTTTLASTAVAGTSTATFPAATGTVMVSGNMPAFSAYLSGSDQTISDATTTKITFNAEEFDTNSNFDSTTNYRFTPTVAGYYQISCCAVYRQNPMIDSVILLYKNGSSFKRGYEFSIAAGATVTNMGMMISTLVYMNGSTDYLEVYAYSDGSGTPNLTLINGSSQTYFQGVLVRSA